jgi:sugar O-acyltransferase (sialic acid O-acetyltransferase NeuD family)
VGAAIMREVILWGATGHAHVLNECLFGTGARVVAVFDNANVAPPFPNVPLYVGKDGFCSWSRHRGDKNTYFLTAIGRQARLSIHDWLISEGLLPMTVVHRTAYVAADAELGPGCQILAHATVCTKARLDRSVIVNTAASVDHECRIGAGTHVGPGARLAGQITLGECVFVGVGAVILPKLMIGSHAFIGAGAVVVSDVPEGALMVGVPARLTPR